MNTLSIKQIRSVIRPIYHKDRIHVTQYFGNPNNVYAGSKHLGVDYREFNRMFGDSIYAPFDASVMRIGYYTKIGWGTDFKSDTFTVDGITFYLQATYLHTRKPKVKSGDRVKQGDFVGKGGMIVTVNSLWSGPHEHVEFMPRYKNEAGVFRPDHNNGFQGRIDPIALIEGDVEDYEGRDVRTESEAYTYKIENGKRRYYDDEVVYSSNNRIFSRDLDKVSDGLMQRIPRGEDMELNLTSDAGLITRQITGLFAENDKRGKELNNKHYN